MNFNVYARFCSHVSFIIHLKCLKDILFIQFRIKIYLNLIHLCRFIKQ